MSSILLITALVSSCLCIVQGQSCMTATGGGGDCVTINRCQQLLTLITKKEKTPKDLEILRQSHCGYDKTTPKVCCPGPCRTLNGQTGRCVQIHSCPQLSSLLTAHASQADIALVKNSRCNGIDQYSVCCSDTLDVTRGPVGPTPSTGVTGECLLTAAPPDPRTSDCCGVDGSAGNRIVGGNETAIDQYPWLTIIEYISKDNKLRLLCGGALISGKYVLTAGHCVTGTVLNYGRPTNVRLGEYDTAHKGPDCVTTEGGGNDCTLEAVVVPIERTIPHPEYIPQDRLKRNDIALIKLQNLVQYTDFVRPICLPTQDISSFQTPLQKRLFAAGWGADETRTSSKVKLHVDLPFVRRSECEEPYIDPKRNVPLWRGQLCAGGEKGKDSCKGDSGGPLMYENGKIYEVVGIVSFGPTPCGIENIPGVYTNVYEYLPWIRSQMTP